MNEWMKCMRKEVVAAQFKHLSPENEKNHERNDRGQLVSKFGYEGAASKEQTWGPTVRPAAV